MYNTTYDYSVVIYHKDGTISYVNKETFNSAEYRFGYAVLYDNYDKEELVDDFTPMKKDWRLLLKSYFAVDLSTNKAIKSFWSNNDEIIAWTKNPDDSYVFIVEEY